ncbi:MAG: hypothetical protein KGL38_14445 [Gemmatimonadota bacterium]|nr:hypothetical protein [Gemmatimonadota bacterium]MDE3129206.1 hypothetical protein [Gemmatimonadota bacterium]MDE3172869.1 hypothetical protein [Gemmatimonadota bacterium]MDE3215964.1 hypothetical protein [Gemmatimonadota bacterium]
MPSAALAAARQDFIKALQRDTTPTECPRFLAVLDSFIEWSLAHPTQLGFAAAESHDGTITFSRVGSNAVMWTVSPRKRDMPRLTLLPRSSRQLSPEARAEVVATLNAHTREALTMEDPLRITFGALKNKTARAAVLECMDRLLVAG